MGFLNENLGVLLPKYPKKSHFFFFFFFTYLVEVQLIAGIANLFSLATIILLMNCYTRLNINITHTIVKELSNVVTSNDTSRNNIEETHFYKI